MKSFLWNCYQLIKWTWCFGKSLFTGNHSCGRFSQKKKTQKTIHIIVNGPSLLKTRNSIKDEDALMVNFSILSDEFEKIRPSYYCFMDPAFFIEVSFLKGKDNEEKVKKLWDKFQKVNWNMKLFVPQIYYQYTKKRIHNNNIHIHAFCPVALTLLKCDKILFFFYRRNLAVPVLSNISIAVIYLAIQLNYQNIKIHGLDFDRLENFKINEKNEVIFCDKHYYQSEAVRRNFTMEGFISKGQFYIIVESFANALKQFSVLERYSKYCGINIYNMNENSMVDCFEKFHDVSLPLRGESYVQKN